MSSMIGSFRIISLIIVSCLTIRINGRCCSDHCIYDSNNKYCGENCCETPYLNAAVFCIPVCTFGCTKTCYDCLRTLTKGYCWDCDTPCKPPLVE